MTPNKNTSSTTRPPRYTNQCRRSWKYTACWVRWETSDRRASIIVPWTQVSPRVSEAYGLVDDVNRVYSVVELGGIRNMAERLDHMPTQDKFLSPIIPMIILDGAREAYSRVIEKSQGGFRPGVACDDAVFSLRHLLESTGGD